MITSSRRIIFLSLVFVLSSMSCIYGQEEKAPEELLNKNAIYGSFGIGGIYFTGTGYYERMITQRKKISTFLKVGYGGYAILGEDGAFVLAQYGLLTGIEKHHLEFSLGSNLFLSGAFKDDLPVSAALGYRFQKPRGNFIFRMGIAVPEAVYIGVGLSF